MYTANAEDADSDEDCDEDNDELDVEELTVVQTYSLYNVAGWAAVKSMPCNCVFCRQLLLSEQPLEDCPSEWTCCLSRGGLSHPSPAAYDAIVTAEKVFNSTKEALIMNL